MGVRGWGTGDGDGGRRWRRGDRDGDEGGDQGATVRLGVRVIELAVKLLTVMGVGFLELWAAVPLGLALGLPPVSVGAATTAGALPGVMTVVWLGEGLRSWLLRRLGRGGQGGRQGRLYRVWARYGVIGLGLLGPLLVGAPLAAALGVSLGAPRGGLMFWLGLGVVLWTAFLTVAGTLGIVGIQSVWPWR